MSFTQPSPPTRFTRSLVFSLLWIVLCLPLSAASITLGNTTSTGGANLDGWTVLVVNETDAYTNTSGQTQFIGATNFSFYAQAVRGRVTPFLVRVNANNNFTVVAIGITRSSQTDYTIIGPHTFPFSNTTTPIRLEPGQTVAGGFLDASPNGLDHNLSVIPFNDGGDELWYTGGPNSADSGSITINFPPNPGANTLDLNRVYKYSITITTEPFQPAPPDDILLQPSEVFPGMPPGITIGTLTSSDPNPADSHTYQLVPGTGDTDNASFEIVGDSLRTTITIEPIQPSYSVRLRSTDNSGTPGLSFEKILTLNRVTALSPTGIQINSSFISDQAPVDSVIGQLTALDPNPNDVHTFLLVSGAGDTHNNFFNLSGSNLKLNQPISNQTEPLSFRVRATDLAGLSVETTLTLTPRSTALRLNEIAASNRAYEDEDLETPDWIEIHNLLGVEQNLAGWHLTDDRGFLTKWVFPDVSAPANGFLVVFASGKNRNPTNGQPVHTSFQLDRSGEFLALVRPDGITIEDQYNPFPEQQADVTYGYNANGASRGYLHPPTPGTTNPSLTFAQGANEVRFSHPRGYYTNNLTVILSSTVPGSEIRYTTDGSKPTPTSGKVYGAPLAVVPLTTGNARGTRIIRALAIHSNAPPGRVWTQSYLFPAGTSANPALDGITGQPNLSPAITQHPAYNPHLVESLRALPVISLVKPEGAVSTVETETSIEFFDPDNQEDGFQIDAGIRAVGGHSLGSPKNNFRVLFRSSYGRGQLRYPLFNDHPYSPGATTRFEQLQFRSGSHDTFFWLANPANPPVGTRRGDAQYLRNRWINDMQFRMGHPSLHGRFAHLFINGVYHGQYQLMERPNHQFHASYLGGDPEDYHFTNGADPAKSGSDHGNGDTWQSTWTTLKNSTSNYPLAQRWIDLPNLVDYMLLNFYAGNTWDWNPNQNWMAGGPKNIDQGGWKFYGWDSDIIFQDLIHNNLNKNVPDGLFNSLRSQEEFNILLRDRIHLHFFNNGSLTPGPATETYARRASEIETSLIMETARWQPNAAANAPWDRNDEWINELVYLTNTFLQQRSDIVLNQFRTAGWYPTEAPVFSRTNSFTPPNSQLTLTHPNAQGTIYYTLDGSDPRAIGGAVAATAQSYTSPIPLNGNVHVRARVLNPSGWSAIHQATFSSSRYFEPLAITEIMYHPPAIGQIDGDEYEFIELKNQAPVPLDLSGLSFTSGFSFSFTNGTVIQPGELFVLVRNPAQFQSKYPAAPIHGTYSGQLANNGEQIQLKHLIGSTLLSFSYADSPPWPTTPDGLGFSLVPSNPGSHSNPNHPAAWRASSFPGGSPGTDDPPTSITPIVINEIMTRSPNTLDTIELHNPANSPANLGGWFLSDSSQTPKKFRIPDETLIPPGGFVTFTSSDFNPSPGIDPSFSLSSLGERVHLFSASPAGNLTGYDHGFEFGGSAQDITFGRLLISTGEERFPAQSISSLSQPNAGPRIGPVVITEIHYHPGNPLDEFIELQNLTDQPVPLFNPSQPTNTWRLNGINFDFPPNTSLAPNALLLVTRDTPSQFRSRHNTPPPVQIFGPYPGNLQNSGERIDLQHRELETNGLITISIDAVRYNDRSPWPVGADGSGPSLQKLQPDTYGDDPIHWISARPTPGSSFSPNPAQAPTITLQPATQPVVLFQNATFTASAAGNSLEYQWRYNGSPIPGANTPSLQLIQVGEAQAGDYDLIVFNDAGTAVSSNATLSLLYPASLLSHPENQTVPAGETVTFTVAATSTTPFRLQWRHNGTPLPNATNSSLTLPNVQGSQEGAYDVVITDSVGPITSNPALLTVLIEPRFLINPVHLTAVEGTKAVLGVELDGTLPIGYRWRRGGLTVQNTVENSRQSFLVINPVTPTDAGNYSVVATNQAFFLPGILSAQATLTVLADSDRDGLPNTWETANNLNPADPADALLDPDGDGQSTVEEYIAGTNHLDPLSLLQIAGVSAGPGVSLTFVAVQYRSYRIEYTDDPVANTWLPLQRLVPQSLTRSRTILDPNPTSPRHYRIVTPAF